MPGGSAVINQVKRVGCCLVVAGKLESNIKGMRGEDEKRIGGGRLLRLGSLQVCSGPGTNQAPDLDNSSVERIDGAVVRRDSRSAGRRRGFLARALNRA